MFSGAVVLVILMAVLLFTAQVFLGSVIIMLVSRMLFMNRQDRNDHELRIEYK